MIETAEQHNRLQCFRLFPCDIFMLSRKQPTNVFQCFRRFSLSQRVLCCALFSSLIRPFSLFTAWNLQHLRSSDSFLRSLYWEIATKKTSINGVCRSKTQIYLGGAWPVRGFDDRKIAFMKTQRTRFLMNET